MISVLDHQSQLAAKPHKIIAAVHLSSAVEIGILS